MKFGSAFITLFRLPWKKNNGSEKTTKAWLLGFGRWSGSPEWRTKKKREMRREKKKVKIIKILF